MKLNVEAKNLSYEILIEKGALLNSGVRIKNIVSNHKLFVITDKNVYKFHGETLKKSLMENDVDFEIVVLEPGEKTKSFDVAKYLYDYLIEKNISRKDYIAAFGGGVVGDLTGFVASTILRGVKFIQIPTTLLAQVDSSVGGKVAINLDGGKNLVGSFYPPCDVIIDPLVLETLSEAEVSCGMAEIIKYGAIYDKNLFDKLLNCDVKDNIEEIIYRCVDIKREVVSEDEFDLGLRMILNFGHTFGHIVESYYDLKKYNHGQGVAIGMEKITYATEKMGLTKEGTYDKLKEILQKYNLHFEDVKISKEDGEKILFHDKKSETDSINYVIISEIGKCEILKLKKEENLLWKY